MSTLNYRPEIDGLRAIAVIFVILFHMNAQWLPGGFVGVDVFFVISGYLISTIILRQLDSENFSLANFYARRIKRILPVFYFVLIVTIIVGYLLLQPKDITYLNNSIKKIVIFLGNNFFANSGDYFSLQANETPLIHVWSLAVEEQFYFLWPAISIILFKFKKSRIVFSLILMSSSFLIAEYLLINQQHVSFAYYSLVTRSGELLVGYITAVLMSENTKSKIKFGESYIAYLGITLIFLSAFLLNKSSKFPGINALSVCVGTAMLIYGIEKKNILLHRLLVSKFFVLIGKVSYSLYLWHWPILAYMRYVYGSYKLPLSWLIIAFILTFILSIISYFFVENKARYLKLNLTSSFLSFYVAPTLATFLLIAILNKTDLATEENLSPLYTMCGGEEICHGKINDNCIRGDKSKKSKILIVGDSHTQHYNYFFEELGQKYGWSAKVVSSSSCSPVLDYNELLLPEWAHEGCKNLKNYFWNDYKNYEIIVLSSRWDFHLGLSDCQGHDPDFTKKLEATLHELSKNVKHVYVLSQIPLLPNNPFRIKKFLNLGLPINVNIHSSNFELANEKVKKLTEKYHNVTWVDTASLFKHFDNGVFFNKNPVYMDNTHLNQYGAKVLATLFSENIFRRHMPQPQD